MKEKLFNHKIQEATEDFIQQANKLGIEYILITQKPDDKFVDCNIKMSSMGILAHICALLATLTDEETPITLDEALEFISEALKTRGD